MWIPFRTFITEAPVLKIFSFIIGYTLWFVTSQSQYTKIGIDIPVALYNVPEGKSINTIDCVHVKLAGKKSDLQDINFNDLAVHINGQSLQDGTNPQYISNKTLFLPDHIKLVHYKPLEILVMVTEKST